MSHKSGSSNPSVHPSLYPFLWRYRQLRQRAESWWLVDRASQYNLVWSPTWCRNSYLFTYNTCTFIKILYMFRALPCSSSGGLRRNCIYAVSGIVTLCMWLSCAPVRKELFFLTGAQDSHLQRVTIPEAAYIQLRRRPAEDEQGKKELFFLHLCTRQSPAESDDTRGCIYTITT